MKKSIGKSITISTGVSIGITTGLSIRNLVLHSRCIIVEKNVRKSVGISIVLNIFYIRKMNLFFYNKRLTDDLVSYINF